MLGEINGGQHDTMHSTDSQSDATRRRGSCCSGAGVMRPLRLQEKDRAEALARVRDADAKHDAVMAEIAARGGKTLDQLRSMSMSGKDAFISKYREPRT